MEYRSVQKVGASSLTISLPKRWVVRNGIRPRQQLGLTENADGSLILESDFSKRKSSAAVEINGSTEMALRKVVGAYVSGADRIEVTGRNAAEVCELARLRLSAIEISREIPAGFVLEAYSKDEDFERSALFSRLQSLAVGMISLHMQAASDRTNHSAEMAKRESEVDRLYLLFLRHANRNKGVGTPVFDILAVKAAERLADNVEEIAWDYGQRPCPEISAFLSGARECVHLAFDSFLKQRCSEADFAKLKEFVYAVEKHRATAKDRSVAHFTNLHCLERIAGYCFDLLELALDKQQPSGEEQAFPLKR